MTARNDDNATTSATCHHSRITASAPSSRESAEVVSHKSELEFGQYAIDSRIFLIILTLVMVASLGGGIYLRPPVFTAEDTKDVQLVTRKLKDEVTKIFDNADNKQSHDNPACQHLLVDIKGVDEHFLNSEKQLSYAMLEAIRDTDLTMLSYHCHMLLPAGVSCVGILLQSHISFHTWPEDGVITLDLFTCVIDPLLPMLDSIDRVFAVGDRKKIQTQWSLQVRGFPLTNITQNSKPYLNGSSDLSRLVLSPLQLHSKNQVHSSVTKYHHVDIWDIVNPSEAQNIETASDDRTNPSYSRPDNPDCITPDRLFFLNGVLQNQYLSNHVYNEAIVHPAMFAHPDPKHVVILGGSDGASLREVLKHKTVQSVILIESDKELISIARKYLPELNNCSDLLGSSQSCFDDQRVTFEFKGGRTWFFDRFGPLSFRERSTQVLDVILMDYSKLKGDTDVSVRLHSDKNIFPLIMESLSNDGVLAIQFEASTIIDDSKSQFASSEDLENIVNLFDTIKDVRVIFVYEEEHCGLLKPRVFLLVCKSDDCRSLWYADSDHVDNQISKRIISTHSNQKVLKWFNGTTQSRYQRQKMDRETKICRQEPVSLLA